MGAGACRPGVQGTVWQYNSVGPGPLVVVCYILEGAEDLGVDDEAVAHWFGIWPLARWVKPTLDGDVADERQAELVPALGEELLGLRWAVTYVFQDLVPHCLGPLRFVDRGGLPEPLGHSAAFLVLQHLEFANDLAFFASELDPNV